MFGWTGVVASAGEKVKDDSSVFDELEREPLDQATNIHNDVVVVPVVGELMPSAHDESAARQRKGHALHQSDDPIMAQLESLLERPATATTASSGGGTASRKNYDGSSTMSSNRSLVRPEQARRRRRKRTPKNSHLSEYHRYLLQSNMHHAFTVGIQWWRGLPPARRHLFVLATCLACLCLVVVMQTPASYDNPALPRTLRAAQKTESDSPLILPDKRETAHQRTAKSQAFLLTRDMDEQPLIPPAIHYYETEERAIEPPNHRAIIPPMTPNSLSQSPPLLPKPPHYYAQDAISHEVSIIDYQHGKHQDYLPHHLRDSFADVWDISVQPTDRPLFWHIPRAGGTFLADIFTHCLHLVSASKIGATEGHGQEPMLEVNTYRDKGRYVNIDTSTLEGLQRAQSLGLVPSGLADVVVTHRFHEGAALFDASHRARVFAMFRHPVRRAISLFYYLQRATWEPTYDASLANMSLEEYATSTRAEENWVTRFLTHEYQDVLTEQHVELAKEILRRKIVVGLLEKFDESMTRFELYFDWWGGGVKKDPNQSSSCQQRMSQASHNKIYYPEHEESSRGYKALAKLNWADMLLYEYAEKLFEEQAALVETKSSSLV